MICGSGGSKSRLAKAAGAEPAGQMRDEKLHAAVARSTRRSQNVQNTTCSRHFWRFRCRKKCTQLWREAHFEANMLKTPRFRTTFGSWDVKKAHAVVARSTFRSQNVQNTSASDHFWKLRCPKSASTFRSENVQNTTCSHHFWRCRKSARRCGAKHISKTKCWKHEGFGPLLEVQMSLRFITLHYTTLHYTTLHYTPHITLHYIAQHYNYITTQLHNYTPLQTTTLNHTTLHYITLHYTPLHYTYNYEYTTTLQYTPLH